MRRALLHWLTASLLVSLLVGARARADDDGNTDGDMPLLLGLLAEPGGSRAEVQSGVEREQEEQDPDAPPELEVTLGGALRFNLFWKSWAKPDTITASGNDVAFDTFRIEVDSRYGPLRMSAEYRFYAGYNMLHHGSIGYRVADGFEVELGVIRVPFGILPYASHNFFFSLGYYVGLEDDYDLGARTDFDFGPFEMQLAYYRNDEGSYSGNSIGSARYSYDVVRSGPSELPGLDGERHAEETNQLNARLAYETPEGEHGSTEVGISGQYGQLRDGTRPGRGWHWAGAVHLRGRYGPFDLQLQAARYGYAPNLGKEQDARFVVMGAYDAPYRVASQAYLFVANLAYRLEVSWSPLSSITFYENWSSLTKVRTSRSFANTHQSVTGMLLHAGPVYAYLDAVVGRNHPWIGPDYADALAEGNQGQPWRVRLNANVGYYF